jgi:hypothetical protein
MSRPRTPALAGHRSGDPIQDPRHLHGGRSRRRRQSHAYSSVRRHLRMTVSQCRCALPPVRIDDLLQLAGPHRRAQPELITIYRPIRDGKATKQPGQSTSPPRLAGCCYHALRPRTALDESRRAEVTTHTNRPAWIREDRDGSHTAVVLPPPGHLACEAFWCH